jgi:putative tryptophan/tyrosine transport system substrate-binding protein
MVADHQGIGDQGRVKRTRSCEPVIGFLGPQSADDSRIITVAFIQSLKEAGYVVGQNVAIEYRFADGQIDRLPALAADLIRRRAAMIISVGAPAALAAKAATKTIPIVFATGGDPVALGLVPSLDRPGANLTGVATFTAGLEPKLLQLLQELITNVALFGVLWDPTYPDTPSVIADLHAAAHTLGLQLIVVNARTDSDIEMAFATFSQQHVGAVLIGNSAFLNLRLEHLAAVAARHALPAIFPYREYAFAGGLISYGSSLDYGFHQLGIYAGRILKGDKPADLPVEQAVRIELTLNLKTAKALGIEFSTALLARAEKVIE